MNIEEVCALQVLQSINNSTLNIIPCRTDIGSKLEFILVRDRHRQKSDITNLSEMHFVKDHLIRVSKIVEAS